jgi:hypothetical protein
MDDTRFMFTLIALALSLACNVVQFNVAADLREMARPACSANFIDVTRCVNRGID